MSDIARVLQTTEASQDEVIMEFGILFTNGTMSTGYDSKSDAEADFEDAMEDHLASPQIHPEPQRVVERMSMRVTTPWV